MPTIDRNSTYKIYVRTVYINDRPIHLVFVFKNTISGLEYVLDEYFTNISDLRRFLYKYTKNSQVSITSLNNHE